MKLSFNTYYLVFALIGWVLLFFFTLTVIKMIGIDIPPERVKYLLAEAVTCGVLAYLTTFIVSLFIDKKVDFSAISRLDIYKIAALFLLTQLIYNILIWPLLDMVDFWGGSNSTGVYMSFTSLVFNAIYFLTLYIIWLFVFFTIKMYHHVKEVQLKQAQLEANLKESQLNTLKGQINPHFMFNSLNNIRGLMLEDVDKSRDMLTRLSETLRYSLTKNEINSIALEDELEMVENYVEISKIQLEDRLQFESHIDKETLNKQIPPMVVQMLVENAIKHGIATLKQGGKVILKTAVEANMLSIEVVNSGHLKTSKNTTKLGLENIKQRLQLLYKDEASFKLFEVEDTVVASIKIPLEK